MRVITPQDAAFSPQQASAGVGIYNFYGVASGNYAPVDDPFFTPVANGLYRLSVFAENTDGGATAGALEWEIVQGVTVLATNSLGIFGNTPIQLGSTSDSQDVIAAVSIVFRRSVTGYLGGNSAYRIRAVVLPLA